MAEKLSISDGKCGHRLLIALLLNYVYVHVHDTSPRSCLCVQILFINCYKIE